MHTGIERDTEQGITTDDQETAEAITQTAFAGAQATKAYNDEVAALTYGNVPDFDDISNRVTSRAELL